MAIVHFVNYKKPQTSSGMLFVLRYTMQDKKTVADDGQKYVTGVNCTPQSAYTEFNNTKRLYGKTDGRLFYHFVQSFSVDENISPQTAHEIAVRFAEKTEMFNGFEIVVSTHCDRGHIKRQTASSLYWINQMRRLRFVFYLQEKKMAKQT